MFSLRNIRTATAILTVSTGLLVASLSGGAGATTKPHLVVSPSRSLTNKKIIKVSGTGFKAKDQVYITECQVTAKGQAGCDINLAIAVEISATGVLPLTRFKVATGVIGNGKCGTTAANLWKCAISVGNFSGGDTASARISFLLPKK